MNKANNNKKVNPKQAAAERDQELFGMEEEVKATMVQNNNKKGGKPVPKGSTKAGTAANESAPVEISPVRGRSRKPVESAQVVTQPKPMGNKKGNSTARQAVTDAKNESMVA
jgi:hypothetical protein